MNRGWLPLSILLLAGCPEPVDEIPAAGGGGPSAPPEMSSPPLGGGTPPDGAPPAGGGMVGGAPPDGAPPAGGAAGGGPGAPGAAPPSMGTFAGDLSDSELVPRFTQEALADGGTIKGTLACDSCAGQLLVRVLPPPPEDPTIGAGADSLQLITQATFPKVGAYTIRVPRGEPVILQVVDDANADGLPSQGERMGMRKDGSPVIAEDEVAGINLTVGVFPEIAPSGGFSPPTPGSVPTPDGPPPGDGGPPPGDGPSGAAGGTPPPPGGGAAGGAPPPGNPGGPPADDG